MINNFLELELSPQLMRGLDKMGFQAPTQVQGETIDPMLLGGDLLVQAPTGTGKTCAFGIPVVEQTDPRARKIQTVILCPTRELAIQTTKVLKSLTAFKPGIRIQAIYGGEPIGHQISALRRKPQIVVATPGRLMDHMNRRTIRLNDVERIVLDEADRMLDMGFREDIDTILESVPEERQTVLFSATMSADIKRIATKYQAEAQEIHIKQTSRTVDRIEQFYSEMKPRIKPSALLQLLNEKKFGRTLIFVATKSMAEQLSEQLNGSGFRVCALHGDLRQRQRDAVMDKYRHGKVNILVATDVAARGIDVHNIDAVINYDIPNDVDSYIHRIGRTGRADQTGTAYTFVAPFEYKRLMGFASSTKFKITKLHLDNCETERPAKYANNSKSYSGKPRSYSDRPKWQKKRKFADKKRAESLPVGA